MTVFVDFVKLINDGLGPLSKCTWTLKTKLHPYVFKTKNWYINPKRTQQKSELQTRTNLYSKKHFWRNQLKWTVLQDSPQIFSRFTWGFGSVVPKSGNQLNSSSVEETCVALRVDPSSGWWGTDPPENGWIPQNDGPWALATPEFEYFRPFFGVCDLFSGV